jgi:hypothetical protein
VRRRHSPGLISSLPGTAELPQFICFSTSYPELDSAVQRATLSNLEKKNFSQTKGMRHVGEAFRRLVRNSDKIIVDIKLRFPAPGICRTSRLEWCSNERRLGPGFGAVGFSDDPLLQRVEV